MRRIILHVGMHKTASTSLQMLMRLNSAALAKDNVIYPSTPGAQAGHHHLISHWHHNLAREYPPAISPDADWRSINELKAGEPVTVILSTEEFSRYAPSRVDFGDIRQRLTSYDQIEVVCVLREQLSLLQSIYLQTYRDQQDAEFIDWIVRCFRVKFCSGVFLDYLELDEFLSQSFGAENVKYLSYESLSGNDTLLPWFLSQLGIQPSQPLRPLQRKNTGRDPLGNFVASQFIDRKVLTARQADQAGAIILHSYPEKRRTSLYRKAEILAAQASISENNQRFRDHVQERFQGGLASPEIKEDTLYRCELELSKLGNIEDTLKRLHRQ